MNKNLYIIIASLISGVAFSQTGVNTSNPQGVFNIDGQKDNAGSLTPTAAQQLNDVVVLANGNVGLGTTSPNVKFTVVTGGTSTSPKPDIKIVDGNQTAGHTMISDAASGGTIDYKSSYYLNGYISSSPTTISQTGFTVESVTNNPDFSIGGVIIRGSNYISGTANDNNGSFIQGSSIINVGPGGVDLHILIENIPTPAGATGASWQYTPNNAENIFYAVPINPA